MGQETGNYLDSIWHIAGSKNSQFPERCKGLTHIPKWFLQKADPHQMKTADHRHRDSRLVETRKLMVLRIYLDPNQSELCV